MLLFSGLVVLFLVVLAWAEEVVGVVGGGEVEVGFVWFFGIVGKVRVVRY